MYDLPTKALAKPRMLTPLLHSFDLARCYTYRDFNCVTSAIRACHIVACDCAQRAMKCDVIHKCQNLPVPRDLANTLGKVTLRHWSNFPRCALNCATYVSRCFLRGTIWIKTRSTVSISVLRSADSAACFWPQRKTEAIRFLRNAGIIIIYMTKRHNKVNSRHFHLSENFESQTASDVYFCQCVQTTILHDKYKIS
jgi:hypothetical protein